MAGPSPTAVSLHSSCTSARVVAPPKWPKLEGVPFWARGGGGQDRTRGIMSASRWSRWWWCDCWASAQLAATATAAVATGRRLPVLYTRLAVRLLLLLLLVLLLDAAQWLRRRCSRGCSCCCACMAPSKGTAP